MADVETINPDSICTQHEKWIKMTFNAIMGWWCPECKAYYNSF